MNDFNKKVRQDIIRIISKAQSGHPGGSLSIVEILSVLYNKVMNIDPSNPKKSDRDIFILSKGHAAPALYAVLAHKNYFPLTQLDNLRQLKSPLQGHPDRKKLVGVEASTGSLGQGISMATGMALGFKSKNQPNKVYALVGDGEMQEGIVWEASMSAAHYKLDNLTIIVDYNQLQIDGAVADVMSLGLLKDKLIAFGYHVIEVDGHNEDELLKAFQTEVKAKPKFIIAHTVKGKGVSFMENQSGWHGKAPDSDQTATALKELQ